MIAPLLAAAALAVTPVGVGMREYRLSLYRATVKPGVVKLNVTNRGEDGHDLAVTKGTRVLARAPEIRSGRRAVLRVRLRTPGRYRLECTLPRHAGWGMRARLTVRR